MGERQYNQRGRQLVHILCVEQKRRFNDLFSKGFSIYFFLNPKYIPSSWESTSNGKGHSDLEGIANTPPNGCRESGCQVFDMLPLKVVGEIGIELGLSPEVKKKIAQQNYDPEMIGAILKDAYSALSR